MTRTIAGREVVFWRNSGGALVAGPGACPHLGALLDKCPVVDGTMYCRWHGFALTQAGDPTWSPYRAYDDGVLIWVGLPTDGEEATKRPSLPARPPLLESVSAVIAKPGICEPQDVIANRLDPWHGSWFHPYAFSHLIVDDDASSDQALVVDVTFRLSRTWGVPVRPNSPAPTAGRSSCTSPRAKAPAASWRPMPPRSALAPTITRARWSPKPPSRTRIGPASKSHAGYPHSYALASGTRPGSSGWTTSHTPNAATSCASAANFLVEAGRSSFGRSH